MPQNSPVGRESVPASIRPYFRKVPIVPGRSLIPGRKEPTFPAFCRVEAKPVTFRSEDAARSREEREGYVIDWIARVRGRHPKLVVLMIPYDIYLNPRTALFHAGWTLTEREGEIRTHQCVVFLSGEAVPVGRSDQGVICVARRSSLSAWDGRTEEQSRAQAA